MLCQLEINQLRLIRGSLAYKTHQTATLAGQQTRNESPYFNNCQSFKILILLPQNREKVRVEFQILVPFFKMVW